MSKRILLIDDDREDAELFEAALGEVENTATFLYMENPKKALEDLQQIHFDLPHIIFLDINMPLINGWECLKAIKNHQSLKQIRVIMYSTSSHPKEIQMASELGADSFLTKPHSFNDLKLNLIAILSSL